MGTASASVYSATTSGSVAAGTTREFRSAPTFTSNAKDSRYISEVPIPLLSAACTASAALDWARTVGVQE